MSSEEETMRDENGWKCPKPVAFAWVLCLPMVFGEFLPGAVRQASTLVFYTSLPAVLWMIINERKRDAGTIDALRARIERLERSVDDAALRQPV